MKCIHLKVDGQMLNRLDNEEYIAGSKNYFKCLFTFTEDLKTYCKVAKFRFGSKEDYQPILNDQCIVPNSMTKFRSFCIQVLMIKGEQYIPTNEVTIRQEVTS